MRAKAVKSDVQGRSFLINILGIILNLVGLTFLAIGYHESMADKGSLFIILGYSLFFIGLAMFFLLKGIWLASYVARGLTGGIFIVSGLIKANDPIGFSYKLEEYFEDGALAYRIKEAFGWKEFSLEFLIDWALPMAIFLCILEIVLGVMVIIGGKIKLTSWLLLGIMIFFTALTWHTASCDKDKKFTDRDRYPRTDAMAQLKIEQAKTDNSIKIISKTASEVVIDQVKSPQCVSDCGCFGDAMKGSVGRSLTPKESLWKDIVLDWLIILIFAAQWKIKPNSVKDNLFLIPYSLVVVVFFSWIFGWYFTILFALICIVAALFVKRSQVKAIGNYWVSALVVTLISAALVMYVLAFEPLKDYRPYAIGSNIPAKMKDGVDWKYTNAMIYKNLKTGKILNIGEKEYMKREDIWGKPELWKYVDRKQIVLKEGRLPSITESFSPVIALSDVGEIEKNSPFISQMLEKLMVSGVTLFDKTNKKEIQVIESEYTPEMYDTIGYRFISKGQIKDPGMSEIAIREWLLDQKMVFVIVAKELPKANWTEIKELKAVVSNAKSKGLPVIMITSSDRNLINGFRKKYGLQIPTFSNDFIELKVIARSNPSLLVLKKGVVAGKFPHRGLPSWSWIEKHLY